MTQCLLGVGSHFRGDLTNWHARFLETEWVFLFLVTPSTLYTSHDIKLETLVKCAESFHFGYLLIIWVINYHAKMGRRSRKQSMGLIRTYVVHLGLDLDLDLDLDPDPALDLVRNWRKNWKKQEPKKLKEEKKRGRRVILIEFTLHWIFSPIICVFCWCLWS